MKKNNHMVRFCGADITVGVLGLASRPSVDADAVSGQGFVRDLRA
jgi:hypothetical protein